MSTPKNIILLSDGTGNAASRVWKSNVWRVFESLDLRSDNQVAFYDDGVGTSSFRPLAILGGAFGWGLKRNVLDIYKFLCVNYQPGDKIYGFGFSRGAFTMRVVIGLILHQGLVTGDTEAEIYAKAKMAYRAFRAARFHTVLRFEWIFRVIRDVLLFILGKRYDQSQEHADRKHRISRAVGYRRSLWATGRRDGARRQSMDSAVGASGPQLRSEN